MKSAPYRILHGGGNRLGRVEAAVAAGVDAVEADAWWYRGRPVVRHARASERTRLMYEAFWVLPHWGVPELASVASSASGRIDVHIDLKSEGERFCTAVVDVVRRAGITGTTSVSSQRWTALEQVAALEPALTIFYSIETERQWQALTPRLSDGSVRGVSISAARLTRERIDQLHDAGIRVNAWTVDDRRQAAELIDMGIDGLVSNSLDVLTAAAHREQIRQTSP